ncbi:MAG TPA: DUF3187 family protein [Steroidobacteraceae bacterium]
MRRLDLYVAGAATLLCGATTDLRAEPFLVRNQHPLVALYGLPSPLPARLPAAGATRIAGVINWSSFAVTEAQGAAGFTLDGEVFETRLHLDHAFGERFALHAELAYRDLSEGSLDGFIENWHDVFNLPNGSRTELPADQLLLDYHTAAATLLHVEESVSGIADIPISVGYQLLASETSAASAWLSVKAPAGKAEDLTGSGALDVALSVAGDHQVAEGWQVFGQANLVWLGDGDLLPDLQESYAWSALAGVTWNPWRALDLTVQFEANSAVLDTGLDGLDGDAVVLTFGGSYRTAGAWQFDLGISEDIDVDASPDVVFNLGVRHGF